MDTIIDPVDTRKVISEGINAANLENAEINELRTGVFKFDFLPQRPQSTKVSFTFCVFVSSWQF